MFIFMYVWNFHSIFLLYYFFIISQQHLCITIVWALYFLYVEQLIFLDEFWLCHRKPIPVLASIAIKYGKSMWNTGKVETWCLGEPESVVKLMTYFWITF